MNNTLPLTQKFVDDCCNTCNGACLDDEPTLIGPTVIGTDWVQMPLPDFTTGEYDVK